MPDRSTALVLSGGVALGSYQAGVYEALAQKPELSPAWIAGSSAGTLNGALIAGTPPEQRCEVLRTYWLRGPESLNALSFGMSRHALNWVSAVQSRLFGALGHLQSVGPRLKFSSFYDLAPTVAFFKKTIDFGAPQLGRHPLAGLGAGPLGRRLFGRASRRCAVFSGWGRSGY